MSYLNVGSSSDTDSSSSSDDDESSKISKPKFKNLKIRNKQENGEEDDDEEDDDEDMEEGSKNKKGGAAQKYLKTKDEITIDEMEPVVRPNIVLEDSIKLVKMGKVLSIVDDKLVVIQSVNSNDEHPTNTASKNTNSNAAPLDEETILFDSNRRCLGKIFETFGPVANPFYSVRFNTINEIKELELCVDVGSYIYYASESPEYTKYIFNINELRKLKGSDASWNNDNEPPAECLDYSDDEQERLAKKMLKNKNKKIVNDYSSDETETNQTSDDEKHDTNNATKNKSNNNSFKNKKNNFNQNKNDNRSMKRSYSSINSNNFNNNRNNQMSRSQTFSPNNNQSIPMGQYNNFQNNQMPMFYPNQYGNNNPAFMCPPLMSQGCWPNQPYPPFYPQNFGPNQPMNPYYNNNGNFQQNQFQQGNNFNSNPNNANNHTNNNNQARSSNTNGNVVDRRFIKNANVVKKSF